MFSWYPPSEASLGGYAHEVRGNGGGLWNRVTIFAHTLNVKLDRAFDEFTDLFLSFPNRDAAVQIGHVSTRNVLPAEPCFHSVKQLAAMRGVRLYQTSVEPLQQERRVSVHLPPRLRQTVKTQFAFSPGKPFADNWPPCPTATTWSA